MATRVTETEKTKKGNPVFPVDKEHGGIRLTVGLLFLLGLPVSYIVINALIPSNGINLIAFIGSIALTYVVSQQVENILKRHWRSGRKLAVKDDAIRVTKHDTVQSEIDPTQQVNVLMWQFEITKRARIPKGWHMIACALEQDGVYLPAYTFVSPEDFESMERTGRFTKLLSKKELKSQGMGQDMRLAGEQRRLHKAEAQRWMYGAEMTQADFSAYLDYLQNQFPQWML